MGVLRHMTSIPGSAPRVFRDRREAGRAVAQALLPLSLDDPLVLALPRGGVPVGYQVARALGAPLDVLLVRKVGAPGNPEYGIGAIAEGGVRVLDHEAMRALLVSAEELEQTLERARGQLAERLRRYRGGRPATSLEGRTVVVVDDGLATGGTAAAALRAARARGAARLVLAVPVGSPQAVERLRPDADEIVCVQTPAHLLAVGAWYEDFGQTTDAEVVDLLERAHAALDGRPDDPPDNDPQPVTKAVRIPVGDAELEGDLTVPDGALGIVIFAHGSGSSRHSPRNRQVAAALQRAGLATLLLDLLTPEEEHDRRNVFDIELLARRLVSVTGWAGTHDSTSGLPAGYFGASTGGGAALVAAARAGAAIRAVVSRGGRPDLAGNALSMVDVPVLLIVGGHDPLVLELNREALARLRAPSELAIVPGATHLFEEPGALEEVSRLAARWFARHLVGLGAQRP
ncbi:MAG: dienelactone hydrolase family protein [Solirubrobacteraceae bacterium]|nr:dienelactone hydrolase family protein [Solirubrobacteraceae bacterium]